MVTCVKVIFTATVKHPIPQNVLDTVHAAAKQNPGFLGMTSHKTGGQETTISYWTDRNAIHAWANTPAHMAAKDNRNQYYHSYDVTIIDDHPLPKGLTP